MGQLWIGPLNASEPLPDPISLNALPNSDRSRARNGAASSPSSDRSAFTQLDRAALATYCGAYGLWAEATEAIQKYGVKVKSPQGFPIQSPYLAIGNRQAEIMMWIVSEFGLTPASRSRISTPEPREPSLFERTMSMT